MGFFSYIEMPLRCPRTDESTLGGHISSAYFDKLGGTQGKVYATFNHGILILGVKPNFQILFRVFEIVKKILFNPKSDLNKLNVLFNVFFLFKSWSCLNYYLKKVKTC